MLLASNSALADTVNLRINADIAPIHSLVSLVAGDQNAIELIIPSNQSPHDFSLKPSQIRSINQADLIVVVSKAFSPTLSRHLTTLNKNTAVLDLTVASELLQESVEEDAHLLEESALEDAHSHDESTSNDEDQHEESTLKNDHEHQALARNDEHTHQDEHTWLNPQYAITWLPLISDAMAKLDEPNRALYEARAATAVSELKAMQLTLLKQLEPIRDKSYIVYHDAYRHFAQAFQLSEPVPIALSDARAPGAAKLRQIRAASSDQTCIFSEAQHDDAIVNTVSAGLPLKRGILDPLGSAIPIGPNHYSQLMNSLAKAFLDCLGT